jgi:hypothetical protein
VEKGQAICSGTNKEWGTHRVEIVSFLQNIDYQFMGLKINNFPDD